MTPRHLAAAVALAVVCAGPAAADAKLGRAEIAKRGKAATAFVLAKLEDRDGTRQGSAFCVHPSGLFITSAHVVAGATAVELVLNPSLPNQQVFAATVVRADEPDDLALLKVEAKQGLPVLELGDDRALEELADVVACGYPFGSALAAGAKEYPSVTVTAGTVTSLRMKSGELELIQLDVSLNPGNSGGPILGADGKVLGVVKGGIRGAQLNFAVPVRRLLAFAARPEIRFTAPALTPADRGKAIPVEARLISALSAGPKPEVELVVRRGTSPAARHALAGADGTFRANVVLLPPGDGPAKVALAATFADGALSGMAEDRAITVGGQSVQLAELRAVYPGAAPRAVLRSGKRLDGPVSGLAAVPVTLGGRPQPVDLSAATEILVTATGGDAVVVLEVVAKLDGRPIGSASRAVVLNDAGKVYLADLAPFETKFGPWPLGVGTTGSEYRIPIKVKGQAYPRGLGLHPPAYVKYRLNRSAVLFRTGVAYDDSNDGKVTGPYHLEVHGDGRLLWKSRAITSRHQLDECEIDVSGVDVLELRVNGIGSGFGAHAVWLDPFVVGPDAAAIRRAAGAK